MQEHAKTKKECKYQLQYTLKVMQYTEQNKQRTMIFIFQTKFGMIRDLCP